MTFQLKVAHPGQEQRLDIMCVPEGDAYRIYVWPNWMPSELAQSLDESGEAYPVYVDLDELDRQMTSSGVEYRKQISTTGSVQLEARGNAAAVLMMWLSRMFRSGSQGILD